MNNVIDIINLITIEITEGKVFRLCDNIADTLYLNESFKAMDLLLISSITEAVSLRGPAYTVSVLMEKFLSYLGIADPKVLRHKKITLQKVDLISQRAVFTHQSHITSVTIRGNELSFTIASTFVALNRDLAEGYSPLCRAEFCDKRCGLDVKKFAKMGKITKILDSSNIQLDIEAESFDELHIYGYMPLTIIACEGKMIKINNLYNYKLEENFEVRLIVTCDKRSNTCIDKFSNIINFRGEPYVNDTINMVL